MGWVFQDAATRGAGLLEMFGWLAGTYLDDECVLHVVEDACATLWRSPRYEPPAERGPGPQLPPEVAERGRIFGELTGAAHPHEPHWYLNVIATVPSRRGHGLGAVALQSVLDRCDEAGEPAYLESSNPRNMTLYRRHGFDDFADPVDLPDGPSLYPMWREARSR